MTKILMMALFSPKPAESLKRIEAAMREIIAISSLLQATVAKKSYGADWSVNKKRAQDHLSDALNSLGGALSSLGNVRSQTRWEELSAEMDRAAALANHVKSLDIALTATIDRAAKAEALAAHYAALQAQGGGGIVGKVRLVVMAAIHPDRAIDPAEVGWRTKLCQSLFPAIDQVISGG